MNEINRRWLPLTVGIANGEIFITIGIEQLCEMANQSGCFDKDDNIAQEESDLLAASVANVLIQRDEDGTTIVSRMFDQACAQMAEEYESDSPTYEE